MAGPAITNECVVCHAPSPRSIFPFFCSKLCYVLASDAGWDRLRGEYWGPGNPRELIFKKFRPESDFGKECVSCDNPGNIMCSEVCSTCVGLTCGNCTYKRDKCMECGEIFSNLDDRENNFMTNKHKFEKYNPLFSARLFMKLYNLGKKDYYLQAAERLGDLNAMAFSLQRRNLSRGKDSEADMKIAMVLAILNQPAACREIARYWISYQMEGIVYPTDEKGKFIPHRDKENYWFEKAKKNGDRLVYALQASTLNHEPKIQIKLLWKAAKQKCPMAYGMIGNAFFIRGKKEKAIAYYMAGMKRDDLFCIVCMSVFMCGGAYGVERDIEKAISNLEWVLTLKCDRFLSPHPVNYARNWLGSHYTGHCFWSISPPEGIFPVDKKRAISLLTEKEEAQSMFFLGKFYFFDEEYMDHIESKRCFQKSSSLGYEDSKTFLEKYFD
jgi:hypothetical protein